MEGVAVIGAGYWGQKIIEEYCNLVGRGDLVSVAVADTDEKMVSAALQNFRQIAYGTTNVEKTLSDPAIRAVHVCTPNETHYSIARDALEAGKHVLLEKPMAMRASEAYALVERASSRRLVLQVGHIFRFNEAIRTLRELVQEGRIGRVYSVRIRWTFNMLPLPDRDIIFDLGPHPVDIAHYVLGEWPHKVTGRGRSYVRRQPGREEEAVMVLEFSDGKDAFIELSWIAPGEKIREVFLRGSTGSVRVDALRQNVLFYPNGKGAGSVGEKIAIKTNNTIADEITHFLRQTKDPTGSINSGYIGARTVEVLDAVRKSMIEERTVSLHELSDSYAALDSRFSKIREVTLGEGTKVYDQVNLYKCKVGSNCKIDSFVYIEADVEIGDNVKIRPFTFIPSGVKIENEVFIGPNVLFTNDKYPRSGGNWKRLTTIIERGASIGAGAVICPGVTIGEGAIVGAGTVVTKDVEAGSIVVGNPSQIIGSNRIRN